MSPKPDPEIQNTLVLFPWFGANFDIFFFEMQEKMHFYHILFFCRYFGALGIISLQRLLIFINIFLKKGLDMFKIFPVFALLCCVMITPAHANWCRDPVNGGVVPCESTQTSWSQCGEFQGEPIYCYPSGGGRSKAKKHDNTTMILVSVGVGAVVVAAAWYFFKKRPSENNPGQVQLATF